MKFSLRFQLAFFVLALFVPSSMVMAQNADMDQGGRLGYDYLKRPTKEEEFSARSLDSAPKLGRWNWSSKKGLTLARDTEQKNSFWVSTLKMPEDDRYQQDYVITAVVSLGKHPDFSLLFKATFPDDLAQVDGYSLSLEGHKLLVHRWDGGYPVAISDVVRLDSLPGNLVIHVIEFLGAFSVEVIDSASTRQLAHFTLADHSFDGTQIGFRAHKKQDRNTALTALGISWGGNTTPKKKYRDPDHYVRYAPESYVITPQKKTVPALSDCKKLRYSNIEGYDLYRCRDEVMRAVLDDRSAKDFLWAEPRNAFTDEEYRRAVRDMSCEIPMHCDPGAPVRPNRAAKDVDMVQAFLDAYVPVCRKTVRSVHLETIGSSYLGHPIRAIVLSNVPGDSPRPRVLFNGAHHGMELLSTDMAFDVLEQLCESTDREKRALYDDALGRLEIWIIPTVNLDGNDLYFHASKSHLGRKNGRGVFVSDAGKAFPPKIGTNAPRAAYSLFRPNGVASGAGVDINRNYPLQWGATGEISSSAHPRDYWYRGTAPASEPESQAMMNLFHAEQFASSISFHTVSTRILSPYSIDALRNPPHEQDQAWQLAVRMADAAGKQPSGTPYKVVKNLYSVDGTDQDWFRMTAGTYAYLIEGALHNPTGKKRSDALVRNRPAWETFLDASRHATVVRVRDATGRPLIAEVDYSDVPRLNDEHWMTRCEDGTHAMLCFGERTVTVRLPDGTTQTQSADCRDTHIVLDFVFEHSSVTGLEAFCSSGYCETLTGIDALCALREGQCPAFPAGRYCLIDGQCVQRGTRQADGGLYCNPAENNRAWTVGEPEQ